jgi:hypothetical protein
MMLPVYLGMLHRAEQVLAESLHTLGDGHADEPDVYEATLLLAKQAEAHVRRLQPAVERYGEQPDDEPDRLHAVALPEPRSGPLGLLRDLQDVHLMATFVDATYKLVKQAALALRDEELLEAIAACEGETAIQVDWLAMRASVSAPQALLVAS